MKILVITVCALMLLVVLNSGCFEEDGNNKKERILKIISVNQTPENPSTSDEIIITAIIENSSICEFGYKAYFASGRGGSCTMTKVGAGQYETGLGPFDNGTEVWYVVSIRDYDDTSLVSDVYITQFGQVERSNITTLAITNISQSPQSPTTKDSIITVSADVTSNITLSNVEYGYWIFYPGAPSGRGLMGYVGENTYEFEMGIRSEYKNTQIYYKIAAQDESGNTVVSPTFSIIII